MISAPTRTWLVLVALTLAAMWAGAAGGSTASLGPLGIVAVVLVSGFKVVSILRNFLDLKRASPGWQLLFHVYLLSLGTFIAVAYCIPWPLPLKSA